MTNVASAEVSLAEETSYRLLVNAVSDYAICMLDRSGFVTSWNPGAQRLTGYQASEILGQHCATFCVEDDRRQGMPDLALELSARDGTFVAEGWRIRKDGSCFWAHVVVDPMRDQAGALLGFSMITRDISERRKRELTFKRIEDQFSLMVQGVTDYGVYMLDADGNVSSWNTGVQRITGYREEEILGKDFSVFYTEEDRRKGDPRRALDAAARDGRFENEVWRVRKDGSMFRANVLINPVPSANNGIVGFAIVTHDITQVSNAQAALKTARAALFQSQKMEAIGQLTGGVANDFNNILMAVLGGLEIVRRRLPEDPNITPLLDNAAQAARRGKSLTQRMLAFSRRQELKPEAVDLSALVLGMTDLLQRSAGPCITIETCIPLALEPIYVDPNHLELALLNLIMNARDAMPNGGSITLAARPGSLYPSGRDYICLSVTDAGDGMDDATLSSAREPFFTSRGIGLGLSMVDELAQQSGGRLIIDSRPGEGTVAELWLPMANRNGVEISDGCGGLTVNAHPLVVLAVDDDNVALENTMRMVEDLGHWALGATSEEKALDILRREKTLDLLIIDHNMRRMELAGAIQSESPSLQVICSTPEPDPLLVQLPKPFSQENLVRAIARVRHIGQAGALAQPILIRH